MRDKLIHEYFGVDLETVWQAVQDDLEGIRQAVEHLLRVLDTTSRQTSTETSLATPIQDRSLFAFCRALQGIVV